jgi:predicted CoA-binding protein
MPTVARASINAFFDSPEFAVIGVSADRKKFGNTVFRAMRDSGLRVLPVHPSMKSVEGDACYHDVGELPVEVKSVVTVVPPAQTERVVQACIQRGVKSIWMQPGSASEAAAGAARAAGMTVVDGQCILMFLEPVKAIHKVHRWFNKAVGTYPR